MFEGTPAPVSGTSAPVGAVPPRSPQERGTDKFAYYSLGIQAIISIVALIACFWLIAAPTEATVNTTSFNIIVFIVGVWLGRGVDYGMDKARGR